MTPRDLEKLSTRCLTSLARCCEKLIQEGRAGFEEYELFVCCQHELARRAAAQSAHVRQEAAGKTLSPVTKS